MVNTSNARHAWVYANVADVRELEQALSREIERASIVLDNGNAELALRQIRPMLTHLKRMRAGVRWYVRWYLKGNETQAEDALNEIARHAANIQRLAQRR